MIKIKIKSLPSDFIVKEHINIQNSIIDKGSLKNNKLVYLIYKVTKENISTLKLVDIFLKNNIKTGFIGLKDKYSLSSQYFSFLVPNSDKISLFNKRIENILSKIKNIKNYEFIAYLNRPLKKQDLIYNEFSITLRDIDKKELEVYIQKIELFKNFYFLNFYDDQRFPIKLEFSINDFFYMLNQIKSNLIIEKDIINFTKNYKNNLKSIFKINFLKDRENLIRVKLNKDEVLFSFYFNIFFNLFSFLLFDKNDLKIYISEKNVMILFDINNQNKEIIKEKINLFIQKNEKKEKNNTFYQNREIFMKINDLEFEVFKDELSKSNRYKIILYFKLRSGGYATTFLKHIIPINPISSTKTKFIKFM